MSTLEKIRDVRKNLKMCESLLETSKYELPEKIASLKDAHKQLSEHLKLLLQLRKLELAGKKKMIYLG